jgi:hypothetical protein
MNLGPAGVEAMTSRAGSSGAAYSVSRLAENVPLIALDEHPLVEYYFSIIE